MAQARASGELVERMDVALHGLCQPLTVLQCRLALGEMIDEPAAMRDAIREALRECGRLNAVVGTMREMLLQAVVMEESERA
jgi:hypothetical protein